MLKVRWKTMKIGRLCHTFVFTGRNAESMKGGVLMKSKYIATYGKKITSSYTQSNLRSYRVNDNFRYRCKITDPPPRISVILN